MKNKIIFVSIIFFLILISLFLFRYIFSTEKKSDIQNFLLVKSQNKFSVINDSECLKSGGEVVDNIYLRGKGYVQGTTTLDYHFVNTSSTDDEVLVAKNQKNKKLYQCTGYEDKYAGLGLLSINYCCFEEQ